METKRKGENVYFRALLFLMLDRIRHRLQQSQRMKMAVETRWGRNGGKDAVGNVERIDRVRVLRLRFSINI